MRFAVGSFALCAALAVASCGKKEEKEEAAPTPVKIETVAAQDVRQSWRYSGEIRGNIEVKLAFKQGGYVASLHQVREADGRMRNVQAGDIVPAGTVLARLQQKDYRASLTSATGQETATQGALGSSRADLAQAQADQEKAERDYKRAEALYAAKAMTRPDYDAAVAQHKAAIAKVQSATEAIQAKQGQLQAAQGQSATAQIALGDTNLTTLMPSVIVSKDVEPGSFVAAGTLGFVIADARVVKVEFGVPDSMLSHFKMGTNVPVTVEALGPKPLTGRITEISQAADRNSRVYNIQVSLPNRDRSLKLGMIASVAIGEGGKSDALPLIPITALSTSGSGSPNFTVFVVQDENGKQVAKLRSVRTGETIGRSVAVLEGLTPGDRIIVNHPDQLPDGSAVRATQ